MDNFIISFIQTAMLGALVVGVVLALAFILTLATDLLWAIIDFFRK